MHVIMPFNKDKGNKEKEFSDLVKNLLEQRMEEPSKPKQDSPKGTPPQGEIKSTNDFWSIPNVFYRGTTEDYLLFKALADNGASHTQDQWSAYSREAIKQGRFIPNYQLFYSIISALYSQRNTNKEVEEVRSFLENQAKERWLTILTRISYNPTQPDKIIHDYGLDSQFEESVNFVGPNEWVEDTGTPGIYKALLGSDNISEIVKIYQWLCPLSLRLWRINKRPENIIELVAGFDALSVRVDFGCVDDPGYSYAGLEVARAQNFPLETKVKK